ncbi:MAG: lipoyl(octanoyl) transferase LipB [bacterium]
MKRLRIVDLGTVEYSSAMEIMHKVREDVKHGNDDTLLILEHNPVITIGTDDGDDSVVDKTYIKKHSIPIVKTDRGGGAVVHNNGQIVCYPVLRFQGMPVDLLSEIVSTMYDAVAEFNVKPEKGREPGLWINGNKVGFVGMKIHEGISMHGFAINISNNTDLFKTIKTCGIEDERIGNLTRSTKSMVSIDRVKNIIVSKFAKRFGYLPDKFIMQGRDA